MRASTRVHTFLWECLCVYARAFVSVCVCVRARARVYVCVRVFASVCVCECKRASVCVREYILMSLEQFAIVYLFLNHSAVCISQSSVCINQIACNYYSLTPATRLEKTVPVGWALNTNNKLTSYPCTASLTQWFRRPPRERKVPGSNPPCAGFFRGRVIPVT